MGSRCADCAWRRQLCPRPTRRQAVFLAHLPPSPSRPFRQTQRLLAHAPPTRRPHRCRATRPPSPVQRPQRRSRFNLRPTPPTLAHPARPPCRLATQRARMAAVSAQPKRCRQQAARLVAPPQPHLIAHKAA